MNGNSRERDVGMSVVDKGEGKRASKARWRP